MNTPKGGHPSPSDTLTIGAWRAACGCGRPCRRNGCHHEGSAFSTFKSAHQVREVCARLCRRIRCREAVVAAMHHGSSVYCGAVLSHAPRGATSGNGSSGPRLICRGWLDETVAIQQLAWNRGRPQSGDGPGRKISGVLVKPRSMVLARPWRRQQAPLKSTMRARSCASSSMR